MSGLTSISNQTPDSSDKTANGDKPSKKEGNLESGGQKTKESKTSRRTTSLLNLFMSNSQGMCVKTSEIISSQLVLIMLNLAPSFMQWFSDTVLKCIHIFVISLELLDPTTA